MDCERGNPVSALGVGGNGLWKQNNCSPHLEVAFRPCVSGDLHNKNNTKNNKNKKITRGKFYPALSRMKFLAYLSIPSSG